MKNLTPKLARIQHVLFALWVIVAIAACKEKDAPIQDPEFTSDELAEMTAADKYSAANSVYRALALIDELPDDWESVTYVPEVGVVMDEANADVRNIVSTSAEQAKGYFLSIVPDAGLNGDSWSHAGVGSLTYRAVNDDNCYAVIDVNLEQMPDLKQLRFVPEAVIGENKWQGTPYYAVGDVIKDKKTGVYWICVRPSGGPLAKDYAYFVSFDKSLIKTKEQKQDVFEVTGTGEDTKITKNRVESNSGKWLYAKNLVEERIAYAAAHVFAYLADADTYKTRNYPGANGFYDKAHLEGGLNAHYLTLDSYSQKKVFHIAYGSYLSNSSKKAAQTKYIQPVFSFSLEAAAGFRTLQRVTKAWPVPDSPGSASKHLMSLTAGHDPLAYAYLGKNSNGYEKPFSILDYTIEFSPGSDPQFPYAEEGDPMLFMPTEKDKRLPLIMTQMSLKDHGKAASGYLNVIRYFWAEEEGWEVPDYWTTIENSDRIVFEKGKEQDRIAVPE
jgi:hypothetical protein